MKQNQYKKFIYDEIKDQIIVENIKQDFTFRQQERKSYELAWELNMNFFVGNQYCYVSSKNEISDIEKRYYWENREVYNHIAPIIEARFAKLKKITPNLNVKPISGSQEDYYSSKLAKLILQKAIDKNSVKDAIQMATYWSEITGTAFYKITWENDDGEIIGNIDGNIVKNGDVNISVCSPFEIYPDSNSANDINDCNSIICARAYPVDYINEKYHKHFNGGDVDIFELGNNSFLNGISGRSNITKINHSKKHNHILIIEKYEKPNKKNPNGKLTIICENELLYDGELPYIIGNNEQRGYPFIRQISSKQIGSFWGISVIERCIPVQRAYNAIKNKKHEFIQRIASGVLTVEDGSVDIDNLENEGLEPGKILVYRNGANPPNFLSPNSIPEELKDEEDRLLQELNILSSTSDMMIASNIPTNINSGSALSMLIEQDNSRLSLAGENIRNSIILIGKYILRLYKQFATTPRLYQISDSTGSLQVAYWKNNDIVSDDVILETNNELDDSISNNKNLILSLYEKGLFSDENGIISQTNKMKILNLFGLKNFEQFEDIRELHKVRANKENLNIEEIKSPLEIDEHKIHITEHTRFLICDESKNISEEEKIKL
ncbi:MAG: hypothetical protein IJX17_04880, partial [Clostridia bacterium]|nr:hypothetical protein [Clostridia bacterium]